MAKFTVMIARLAVNNYERVEIGQWLVEICSRYLSQPDLHDQIDDIFHCPVAQVPTPVARNQAVERARHYKADILYMVDEDMAPPLGWFETAFHHLTTHEPCVIAAPYCTGGQDEKVNVFHMTTPNNDVQKAIHLQNINREDAARRTGIERVANIGTGLIAIHMDVFKRFEEVYKSKVYFDYSYNEDHTKVIETEDNYLMRHLYFANVPIWCTWDLWAGHNKIRRVDKPYVLQPQDIEQVYIDQATSLKENNDRVDANKRIPRIPAEPKRRHKRKAKARALHSPATQATEATG